MSVCSNPQHKGYHFDLLLAKAFDEAESQQASLTPPPDVVLEIGDYIIEHKEVELH